MKRLQVMWVFFIALLIVAPACGKSLYGPLSKDSSYEARKEDALVALDGKNYTKAIEILDALWREQKSNEVAQLYAVSLMGTAGLDLLSLIKRAVLSTPENQNSDLTVKKSKDIVSGIDLASAQSGSILDQLMSIVSEDGGLSEEKLSLVRKAVVDILSQAPGQSARGLTFQRCLTAGIYASVRLLQLQESATQVSTLLTETLPNRLQTGGGQSCGAPPAVVREVEGDLTEVFSRLSNFSGTLAEVLDVAGSCLAAAGIDPSEAGNGLQGATAKLLETADKGCAVPSGPQMSGPLIPNCLGGFFQDAGQEAQPGDGIISGCEFFLNCASGECF